MTIYKGITEMGALYKDGMAMANPTRPWIIDLSKIKLYEDIPVGNIADYSQCPYWRLWRLGDTPKNSECRLKWIVLEEKNRRLFICDRVILMRVSWYDLDSAGLVLGKKIEIDGTKYNCRLMTGGHDFRILEDGYSGGNPAENEWDRFVTGEQTIKGLLSLEAHNFKGILNDTFRMSSHNQLWNYFGAFSWTATPSSRHKNARCARGFKSPKYFYLNTFNHRHEDIGWRPVLEERF